MKETRRAVAKRLEEQLALLEALRLGEYLSYARDTRRLIRTQFLAGLFRGMGTAVGFTLLGALLVLALRSLAQRDLPLIGDLLAQIVEIVQERLQ